MGWIIYSVFISFAAPILFGFWLGNRAKLDFGGVLKGALLGLIFMAAVLFITEVQIDLFMWQAYKSEMAVSSALGADWVIQAFGRAIRTMTISYVFFLMVYFIRVFLRGRAARMATEMVGLK